jgi:hypothetical protein
MGILSAGGTVEGSGQAHPLSNETDTRVIEGYLWRESIVVGEQLHIHASTDAAFFRVDLYRIGAVPEFAGSAGCFPGRYGPAPAHPDGVADHASPAVDWYWPAYEFTTPSHWNPGVYVAFFVESGSDTPLVTAETGRPPGDVPYDVDDLKGHGREFFILRPCVPGGAKILYKKSSFTRHAYNRSDGPGIERASSLYDNAVYVSGDGVEPRGHKVSMHRPGGIDDLAYWDAPFIAWLERAGYQVEFCTDLDLHSDPELLSFYRLLLSVGHDEYWTTEMRVNVETFVEAGGNVAFFSANTCWWRVHVTDSGTALVADTDHRVGEVYPHEPATDQWWAPKPSGAGVPENTMTGVSFRNGGMWPGQWPGDRPCPGFTVQHADHWVYEGTGLRDSSDGGMADVLGAGLPLIGYECDGAAFRYVGDGVARATGTDGTPESFLILGIAVLEPVHEDLHGIRKGYWNCASREVGTTGPRAATMGVYTRNGTVFTAATTDWPVIVARGCDEGVDRVTRNVLDRLSS